MSNFDWVTERANCSTQKVFRALELGVKADADKRNAFRKDGEPKWETASSVERFSVFRAGGDAWPAHVIEFALEGDRIAVYSDSADIFGARITINNKGQCRLRVNDQELEEWQFRKKALEDLFFEGLS
jgi:hypothetical protein